MFFVYSLQGNNPTKTRNVKDKCTENLILSDIGNEGVDLVINNTL